jgi:GH25 family lysozyme M1 (1,4-beta-N-acetylmuramidase)
VLAAVLAGGVVTLVTSPADAATTLPDGGGHAQAGGHGTGSIRPDLRTAVSPPPGYSVAGVDVSSHDHAAPYSTIDWNALVASGVKFAYVKATEGKSYTNPYFAADNQAAKAAGLLVGAYTFARPDSRDPVGDANAFIDAAAWTNDSHTLVPFLDLEWPDDSSLTTCYGLSVTDMVAWIQSFLNQVRVRTGRNAMIYTAASWWNECTGNSAAFASYPLDVASYTTTPTLPSGWSTWTLWQYAAGDHSQQGNYDKDVFNGDYDSLRRLAGIDPPPPLTSAPTGFENTTAGQPEVYANAGGDLVQRFYRASDGWSNWSDFGGNLTGEVTVFHNPLHGYTEVYANSGGHLVEKFYSGSGWSAWTDLGGAIDGTPTVLFNPKSSTTEVYARSGTHIVYKYYGGSSWSAWNDLGGNVDGDPSVIYNPNYKTTEVYARSGTSTVQIRYTTSWSAWNDLSGNLTGDPSVFYDANTGQTEIYARSGTTLTYKYYAGSTWYGWLDLGGSITGDPDVIYNPKYGTTEVYAASGTHIAYTHSSGGRTWSAWTDLGGNASSDPSVLYDGYSGNTDVFVNANGELYEKVYQPKVGAWSEWIDLMQ